MRSGKSTGVLEHSIQFIEARGVTRVYSGVPALRGVTARFDAGTITCIEGPNGAGKSTLLGVLGTATKPTRGQVWYEPVGEDPAKMRPHIGWVSHETHCYRELTVRQNIGLAARWYGVLPSNAWLAVASRLGLEAIADRDVGTLSRGQKQRVALGRALVHSPSVLLLDEPWTGLDLASGESLVELILAERARGRIIIVVTHDDALPGRLSANRLRLVSGLRVE